MALMRWEPMNEIEGIRRQMDRMVDQLLGGRAFSGLPRIEAPQAFLPSVEVYATDAELVIKAELPGFEPGDVSVEVTEDALHLTGELKREEEVQEDNYYRSERQYGHFDRSIPLPNRIKEQEARATFKHGLLTVRAPLAEEPKKPRAHKLQVES